MTKRLLSGNPRERRSQKAFAPALFLFLVFVAALLNACHQDSPEDAIANFMVDEKGRVLELRYLKKKLLVWGKEGAFLPSLWNERTGISLLDFSSREEVTRFEPRGYGEFLGAYPLDSARIVCNFRDDSRGARRYHAGVWEPRTGAFRLYEGTGSHYPEQLSGISPDEKMVISCPYAGHGIVFHDRRTSRDSELFSELHARTPRFSPDGSRYAFLASHLLVIQVLGDEAKPKVVALGSGNNPPSGSTLAWSPSGRLLAGIAVHYPAVDYIHVWDADGGIIMESRLPFPTGFYWAPVWMPNEKEILVFCYDGGKVFPYSVLLKKSDQSR